MPDLRRLGQSDLWIAPVALGCWPLAGMTSGPISDAEAVAVIDAALASGVNHFDTAHAYGRDGESERRLGRALGGRRSETVVATKVGVYWASDGSLQRTGRPELLQQQFEQSLARLGCDEVDLLYFHAPAEDAPLAETAGWFREQLTAGRARAIGVSNLLAGEMTVFARECPLAACQVRYNLLQREIETDVLPWCVAHEVSVVAYEPLALGLLTGKFTRDHVFADGDWRRQSPLFTGRAWTRNLELVDRLRPVAADRGCSVAQLAVAWTLSRPGVAAALCGAKRAEQIRETACTMALPSPWPELG
jgi:aryl-alcohol dehydrogenase-like predicted oxidoreductase